MPAKFPSLRSSGYLLAAFLCLVPAILYGVVGALQNTGNDVRQWLPEGFPETRQYRWFERHFQGDEMLLVSWPGATLDDPRIDRLAESLRQAAVGDRNNTSDGSRPTGPLFRQVLSGREALGQLMADPLTLPREEAVRRLQGVLIGPDGQTTGIVAVVSEAGAEDRHAAVEVIYRCAARELGLGQAELRLGGPTVDSVALDTESERSRKSLGLAAVVLSLVLAWRCLRELRLVMAVFATALFAAGTAVALVYYTGGQLSVVLVMMPILIYVLAVSGAIHIIHYYREELSHRGPAGAAARALAAAWKPCTLAALTTAIGMVSLAVSEIVPVRLFGLYSALGVLCTLPALLLLLPAILEAWPIGTNSSGRAGCEPSRNGTGHALAGVVVDVVTRRHGAVVLACVLTIPLLCVGVCRLETSLKVLDLFSPKAKIVADYRWLEENVASLVPVEVVVQFDPASTMPQVDRLQLVSEIQSRVERAEEVGGAISAATFFPPLPEGSGMRANARRKVLDRKIETAAREGQIAAYLQDTDEGQLWRVSARIGALQGLDYDRFVVQLRSEVDPIVEGRPVRITYTGAMPVIYKAQREMLSDLATSFVSAFALIGLMMVVVLRRASAGILSMLPNVFPALVVFGVMGGTGLVCDIGAMMTASIALGIAVDDTIHLLNWFARSLRQGESRREAVASSLRKCTAAMLQTTLVCGLGLMPLSLSGFVPMARFAWLMVTLLGAALLGDLLLLPAILVGPLGTAFERKTGTLRRPTLAAVYANLGERLARSDRPDRGLGTLSPQVIENVTSCA